MNKLFASDRKKSISQNNIISKSNSNLKHISQSLLKAADIVFGTSVNMILGLTVFMAELSIPDGSYGKVWRAERNTQKFLDSFNYEIIKNSLNTAKHSGLMVKNRRHAWPEITAAGRKRLSMLIPFYNEKRIWDSKMYLVTYDIPEKLHYLRDQLREFLKDLGSGKLQDSVWLTAYNPTDNLREFIDTHKITGNLLISSVGKDGSIGDEDLPMLVIRVFRLEDINNRYREWLKQYEKIDMSAVIEYLAILKADPQLPFQLLPDWWVGDKAYKKVKPILQKVSFRLRP